MNGVIKVLLIIAAVIGALWWLAAGVLYWTAGAQTRTVLEQLNTSEEWVVEADRIRLHLDGVGVRNLRAMTADGDQLSIAEARLAANPWALVWNRELHIRQIVIRGLVLEPGDALLQLWREPPATETPATTEHREPSDPANETRTIIVTREPFSGLLFGELQDPADTLPVRIRRAHVEGRLQLPDEQYVAAQFTLRDFIPGRETSIEALLESSLAQLEDLPIRDARIHAETRVGTHRNGLPSSLEGRASIRVLARDRADAVHLNMDFSARNVGAEERYRLQVNREEIATALVDFQGQWHRDHQRSDGQLLVALTEAAVTGLPAWGHFRAPIMEGALEYSVSSRVADAQDHFRLTGSADLPILVDLFDSHRRGQLHSGNITVNLDGRIHGADATATGEIRVDHLRAFDPASAVFSAVHPLQLEASEAGLRIKGPIQLTGPVTTSRGQLLLEDHGTDGTTHLHLELDRFDEQEWRPILNLLPEIGGPYFSLSIR